MTHLTSLPDLDRESHAIVISLGARAALDEAGPDGEIEQLLAGLGVTVAGWLHQHRPEPQGVLPLGRGKLEELAQRVSAADEQERARLVLVFDGDLSPGQARHLARATGLPVIDRTQIILSVFQRRARTRIARLEIELAALEYQIPRVRDDSTVAERQGGGGGRGAKGETGVELRKRELRRRLAAVRAELAAAGTERRARQQRRRDASRVALVGYTNAGKSSWMRALTGSDVPIDDALFVTLDTTVRALQPPTTPRVVVADTVGFLRELPNHLLASFRSTLEEALDADLLLVTVDGADDEWQHKLAVTFGVLDEVGAGTIPRLVLVNKRDRMSETDHARIAAALPDALCVSARAPGDVAAVHARISAFFAERLASAELVVPFAQGALRAEIWAHARVLAEQSDERGVLLRVRARPALLERWQARLRP